MVVIFVVLDQPDVVSIYLPAYKNLYGNRIAEPGPSSILKGIVSLKEMHSHLD